MVIESEIKYSHLYGLQDSSKLSLVTGCCTQCFTACKSTGIIDCRCHHAKAKSSDNESDDGSYSEDTTDKEVMLQVPQVKSFYSNVNFSKFQLCLMFFL